MISRRHIADNVYLLERVNEGIPLSLLLLSSWEMLPGRPSSHLAEVPRAFGVHVSKLIENQEIS